MNQINNEVDLGTVGDVIIHLYYTALDGGQGLHDTVQAYNLANLPGPASRCSARRTISPRRRRRWRIPIR